MPRALGDTVLEKSILNLPTVRFTKSGSVLSLYEISVLLKPGGAGVFIITRKINVVIKAPFKRFDE